MAAGEPGGPASSPRSVTALVIAALVAVVVVATAFALTRGSGDDVAATSGAGDGAAGPGPGGVPTPGAAGVPVSSAPGSAGEAPAPTPTPEGAVAPGVAPTSAPVVAGFDPVSAMPTPAVPPQVSLRGAEGIAGVSPVVVHVEAAPDDDIYAAEARVCRADAPIVYDADFRPTQTGGCALNPLAEGADAYVEVVGVSPYRSLDLTLRTGPGTDSFATQSGATASVTCDRTHPCHLVLKLQVRNTFVFTTHPLSYA